MKELSHIFKEVVYLSGDNSYEEIFDIAEAIISKIDTLVVSISPVVKFEKQLQSLNTVESAREPLPRENNRKGPKS